MPTTNIFTQPHELLLPQGTGFNQNHMTKHGYRHNPKAYALFHEGQTWKAAGGASAAPEA